MEKSQSIYLKGVVTKEKYDIDKGKENIIGRNLKESHVYIEDILVSRKHAEIVFQEGEFYIIDLNSQNGTYINKTKAMPFEKHVLHHNDLITFAQRQYRFKSEDENQIDHSEEIEIEWMQMAQKNKICIRISKSAEFLEFQFQILGENKHVNVLDFERVSDYAFERLYYDVSGLESLYKIVSKRLLSMDELIDIVLKIVKALQDTEKMLLSKDSFILSLHTIFLSPKGEIKLIYVPIQQKNSRYPEHYKKLLAKLIRDHVEYDETFQEEMLEALMMENSEIPDILEMMIWNHRSSKTENCIENNKKINPSPSPQGFFLSKKQTIKHSFLKVRRLIMTK